MKSKFSELTDKIAFFQKLASYNSTEKFLEKVAQSAKTSDQVASEIKRHALKLVSYFKERFPSAGKVTPAMAPLEALVTQLEAIKGSDIASSRQRLKLFDKISGAALNYDGRGKEHIQKFQQEIANVNTASFYKRLQENEVPAPEAPESKEVTLPEQTIKPQTTTSPSNTEYYKRVQKLMNKQLSMGGQGLPNSVEVDGVWGPQSVGALKTWQKMVGIPETGKFDEGTRAKIREELSANNDQ